MRKKIIAALAAMFIGITSALVATPAFAATTVSTESALQTALAAGQSVRLGADITLTGEIEIPQSADVTIDGAGYTITAGTPATAPGGDDQYNMFRAHGGKITLSNLTLDANGKRRGVWVDSGASLTLDKTTIKNGTTASTRNFMGGAIYAGGAQVNITNGSVLENNSAIWSQSTYDIRVAEEVKKDPNFANLPSAEQSKRISQFPHGGAVFISGAAGTLTITDSTIKGNETKDHNNGGTGVRGNDGNGGAIYLDGSTKLVTKGASFIDNHTAKVSTGGYQGGAIFAGDNTTSTISDCKVNVGAPFNTGGFLRAYKATVNVDNCDFKYEGRGNKFGISGGAFVSEGSNLKINNSQFMASPDSKVVFAGGFVDIVGGGNFELTNSKMTGRGYDNGKGLATYGGAIAFETGSNATALIKNTTIENVHADQNGGAISLSTKIGEKSAVNLRVVDSTITKAGTLMWGPTEQVGGAIFVGPGNTLSLEGATLATGRSGRGGLIYNQGSTTIAKGAAPSKLSGGFVYSAVGAGIFNDGYLKLDEMTLGENSKGDWSTGHDHPASLTIDGTADGAKIAEYPGLNVYAHKDVIITPNAKLDDGDVRVIDGQSAVLLTGKLSNQLNVSVSENKKGDANSYAGNYEPAQRYIGYTVAKGTDGYTPVQGDADTIHYVTRDSRQPASKYGDHTGIGAWDYVLSDENTVVLGQRAKIWYHPNEGHFEKKAKDVEEEQVYSLYSSTKLVKDHPAARPGQMTPYKGKDPVRDETTREIKDSRGRMASINTYRFKAWYCKAFTPDQITKGDAKDKGYNFKHGFTDGEPKSFEADSKGHKNPCGTDAQIPTPAPITSIVKPNEMTAYAGYGPAFGVKYKFVSGTSGKELPEEVLEQTPQIDTNESAGYLTGSKVTPSGSSFKPVKVDGGTWTFQQWDATSKTIASRDAEFVGTWVLDQRYKVTHEFKAASGTLPTEIAGRTPADNLGEDGQGIKDGTEVKPRDFDHADFTAADGKVWSFLGWDKDTAKIKAADVHFIGYWGVEPTKDPTFSEWKDSQVTCEQEKVTQTRTKTSYSYKWNKQSHQWDESTSKTTETRERDKTAEEVKACEPTPPQPGTDPTEPENPDPGTEPSQPEKPTPQPTTSTAKPDASPAPGSVREANTPVTGANSGAVLAVASLLVIAGAAIYRRRTRG